MHAQQPGGSTSASPIDSKSYAGMKWRLIGPFRGGRVLTVTGVPSQPIPITLGPSPAAFGKPRTAASPGSPFREANHLFHWQHRGCGFRPQRHLRGNRPKLASRKYLLRRRVYRSNDAGKTWANIGLEGHPAHRQNYHSSHQSRRRIVAALGHAYGTNTERGIFRTRDGGKTWEKVLYLDDRTAALTSYSIPAIPTFFSPPCGRAIALPGRSIAAAPRTASSVPNDERLHLEAR